MHLQNRTLPTIAMGGVSRRHLLAGAGAALAAAAMQPAKAAHQATPAATPAGGGEEQIARLMQFIHPGKVYGYLPGFADDSVVAAIYGVDAETLRKIRSRYDSAARNAAEELLGDADFATMVDSLPFQPNDTVVAIGESSTDDLQSWLAILRHVLALRRPDDAIQIIDRSVSGETTTEALGGFVGALGFQPRWILIFEGGNDARWIGPDPTKTLVSLNETIANLKTIRSLTEELSEAQLVWLTPMTANEELVNAYPPLQQARFTIRNEDLTAIADAVRETFEPVVDLVPVFGVPADPSLLLNDGIHPSIEGYKLILRALVERIAT